MRLVWYVTISAVVIALEIENDFENDDIRSHGSVYSISRSQQVTHLDKRDIMNPGSSVPRRRVVRQISHRLPGTPHRRSEDDRTLHHVIAINSLAPLTTRSNGESRVREPNQITHIIKRRRKIRRRIRPRPQSIRQLQDDMPTKEPHATPLLTRFDEGRRRSQTHRIIRPQSTEHFTTEPSSMPQNSEIQSAESMEEGFIQAMNVLSNAASPVHRKSSHRRLRLHTEPPFIPEFESNIDSTPSVRRVKSRTRILSSTTPQLELITPPSIPPSSTASRKVLRSRTRTTASTAALFTTTTTSHSTTSLPFRSRRPHSRHHHTTTTVPPTTTTITTTTTTVPDTTTVSHSRLHRPHSTRRRIRPSAPLSPPVFKADNLGSNRTTVSSTTVTTITPNTISSSAHRRLTTRRHRVLKHHRNSTEISHPTSTITTVTIGTRSNTQQRLGINVTHTITPSTPPGTIRPPPLPPLALEFLDTPTKSNDEVDDSISSLVAKKTIQLHNILKHKRRRILKTTTPSPNILTVLTETTSSTTPTASTTTPMLATTKPTPTTTRFTVERTTQAQTTMGTTESTTTEAPTTQLVPAPVDASRREPETSSSEHRGPPGTAPTSNHGHEPHSLQFPLDSFQELASNSLDGPSPPAPQNPTTEATSRRAPPGASPPNDIVVAELNDADDFFAVARRLRLSSRARHRLH